MSRSDWTFIILIIAILQISKGSRCKWSNEGCSGDNQCCSGRCILRHPGTNYRCTTSEMGGPCLVRYHCGNRMQCVEHQCCARHWGTCTDNHDCCNKSHICRRMQGFIYKKCVMYSGRRPRALSSSLTSFPALVLVSTLVAITMNKCRLWR